MSVGPTVIVIGAGPAGIAAARRLREQAGVRVLLVVPDGVATYLPGTLAVATGEAQPATYRTPVELNRIEVVPGYAEALRRGAVRVDGVWIEADAIIAAPGLALDSLGQVDSSVVGFWDPIGAYAAAPRIQAVEHGVIQIAVAGLPYRCPPAPYGLALRLAHWAGQLGRPLDIRLLTPEDHPLASLGHHIGDVLLDACTAAGIEVRLGSHLDSDALAAGRVEDEAGAVEDAELTIVIPPHRSSPLLRDMEDGNVLISVDDHFTTQVPGLFVVGDAAASPYPRASNPAAVSGLSAAEAALAELDEDAAGPLRTPEPDCFVDHGAGRYSRIRISYPDGPPPGGRPAVTIGDPAPKWGKAFDDAHTGWQALRRDVRAS